MRVTTWRLPRCPCLVNTGCWSVSTWLLWRLSPSLLVATWQSYRASMICLLYDSALRSVTDAFTSPHPVLLTPSISLSRHSIPTFSHAHHHTRWPCFWGLLFVSILWVPSPSSGHGGSYGQARGISVDLSLTSIQDAFCLTSGHRSVITTTLEDEAEELQVQGLSWATEQGT